MTLLGELWGLLPLAAYGGLVAGRRAQGDDWIGAWLRAAIFWAAGVWVLANVLGLFGALRPAPLRIAWVGLAGAGVAWGGRAWLKKVGRVAVPSGLSAVALAKVEASREGRVPNAPSHPPLAGSVGPFEWTVAAAVGALLLLALVTAVLAPPVTVDVLSYHLPRQLMWLQQGSLEHFVTLSERELLMPPLAEVIGLQFLALTGGDHWANLPQWFAYALLPLAMWRTVRTLGVARGPAALAAWLAVCLPMAWHEASNGKNDLQGAVWIALLLWQVARARAAATPPSRAGALRAGATLALALLTKSTAFIFAPPLLLAGWLAWRRAGGTAAANRAAALAALAAVLLAAPFFARNLAWYGAPLGVQHAEDGGEQTNAAVTPAIIASNALRAAASHLAGPWSGWNAAVDRAVRAAHGWLGVPVDDPRSTLWILKFSVEWWPRAEMVAGAPWHLLLLGAAVLGAALWRGARDWRWLAAAVAAMALLYCAVVRWQLWGARLQLPGFVTGCVLAAGLMGALPPRWRGAALWTAAALGLLAWWPARETSARPLWTPPTLLETPRAMNSYRYHPEFMARDLALAGLVRAVGVHEVEVVALHDIAYPLMRRLQEAIPGVHFYGAPAADAAHDPPAIVVLRLGAPCALFQSLADGARYRLVGVGAGDGLYLPEARVRALGWERRLPAFAGWTLDENLPLTVDEPVVPTAPVSHRVMTAAVARVFFPGWSGRARIAGTVGTTTAGLWLDLSVNGGAAARVELAAPGAHDFELSLPCLPGPNTLELRRPPGPGPTLDFFRLTIDDGAGVARP